MRTSGQAGGTGPGCSCSAHGHIRRRSLEHVLLRTWTNWTFAREVRRRRPAEKIIKTPRAQPQRGRVIFFYFVLPNGKQLHSTRPKPCGLIEAQQQQLATVDAFGCVSLPLALLGAFAVGVGKYQSIITQRQLQRPTHSATHGHQTERLVRPGRLGRLAGRRAWTSKRLCTEEDGGWRIASL